MAQEALFWVEIPRPGRPGEQMRIWVEQQRGVKTELDTSRLGNLVMGKMMVLQVWCLDQHQQGHLLEMQILWFTLGCPCQKLGVGLSNLF